MKTEQVLEPNEGKCEEHLGISSSRKRPRKGIKSSQNTTADPSGQSTETNFNSSTIDMDMSGDIAITHASTLTSTDVDIHNMKESASEPPTNRLKEHHMVQIKKLRLEAIFHPKFDNEHQNDLQIRNNMLSRVSSNQGYLEVTLKHSGSLMLWSGHQRFYSKNSTQNVFTAVGEILLRQHFARAWNGVSPDVDAAKDKFKECSDYVEQHRLTLSFEVVPSILGHHGDIPQRDYLILIAVADKKQERFYSTAELTALAQEFRLPHNDAWLFRSANGVRILFDLYDSIRETGLASTVIRSMDDAADGGIVKSMYPHSVFQGDILEGIVIRYVSYDNRNGGPGRDANSSLRAVECLEQMKKLCEHSEIVLKIVPPQRETDYSENQEDASVCNINLRNLEEEVDLENRLMRVLSKDHGSKRRCTVRLDNRDTGIDLEEVSNNILSSPDADTESRRIAQLIQTVASLKLRISYKIFQEKVSSLDNEGSTRIICIVHVNHDEVFQKYSKATKNTDAMALYRGFSLELITEEQVKEEGMWCAEEGKSLNHALGSVHLKSEPGVEEDGLMLKMKFLPYMVRTFICRNGLSIMDKSSGAFENYSINQFTRWNMSQKAFEKWMPFFRGWSLYCNSPPSIALDGKKLPPLSSKLYLHHYNEFSKLYENGEFKAALTDERNFRGAVILVGLELSTLVPLANILRDKLSCSKIIANSNTLSQNDMIGSIQRGSGGGIVCTTEIRDGMKAIRNLAKRFKNAIYIVMVGCSNDELESSLLQSQTCETRKIIGMTQGWKKCKCNLLLEIPKNALSETPTAMLKDDSVTELINALQESSDSFETDERPGMVVFFPAIPGSGKSELCNDLTPNMIGIAKNRKLLVKEGDKIKGKYYSIVQQQALDNPAAVIIADKNVPPVSWNSISHLCSQSQSMAVAVFPENVGDTYVGDEPMRFVYPFNLEYLAVCLSRVLGRAPNSHNGKLDSATALACMIVVKFFCFYRNKTNKGLENDLQFLGKGFNKILRIPFFKDKDQKLSDDLRQVLSDAITMQNCNDLRVRKSSDQDEIEMEELLRAAIKKHESLLSNLTSTVKVSKQSFQSQLREMIGSLGESFTARSISNDANVSKAIKIVSLDVPVKIVRSALKMVSEDSEDIKQYLAKRDEDICNDEDNVKQDRFITSTHCTFAHSSKISQSDMKASFNHLLGTTVELSATALLYSDTIAALQVVLPPTTTAESKSPIPSPQNEFAHITVWCGKHTKSSTSNQLPCSVETSAATIVEFKNPVPIKGVFAFWYNN